MNVRKNDDQSVIIETENGKMGIRKPQIGCYVIHILPDENGDRKFVVPNVSMSVGYNAHRIYEIFKGFVISMFGNNVINGNYNSPKIQFDPENRTITILSDCSNKATLTLSFTEQGISFQIVKNDDDPLTNSLVYLYSDCNLRGGYVEMFRILFEQLEALTLEPEIPIGRVRQINRGE